MNDKGKIFAYWNDRKLSIQTPKSKRPTCLSKEDISEGSDSEKEEEVKEEKVEEISNEEVGMTPIQIQNSITFKEFTESVKKKESKYKNLPWYEEALELDELLSINLSQELKDIADEVYDNNKDLKIIKHTPLQVRKYTQQNQNLDIEEEKSHMYF